LDNTKSYVIYRKDRKYKRAGGVIGLVSDKFSSHAIPIPAKYDLLELVAFCVVTPLGSFRFITVYRPPEFNQAGREYMAMLSECLEFLCDTKDTVILVGDFNLPNINWAEFDSPNDNIHSSFLNCCVHHGLTQFVNEPTRDGNCLDLVLSNDQLIVSDLYVSDPFSTSDHSSITFSLLLTPHETVDATACYYDFVRADFDALNAAMVLHPFNNNIVVAESADNICFTDSSDDVWNKFVSPLNNAIADNVPVKKKRASSAAKRVRYPRHITRALKRKSMYWKHYRKESTVVNKNFYKSQAAICKKLLFDYEKSKELAVINKRNIGSFYRFLNKKLVCRSGIGPLRLGPDTVVTDDPSKASALNDYFCSVFTVDDGLLPSFPRRVRDDISLDRIEFTPGLIIKAIKSCKKNTNSRDPDGFDSLILHKLMYNIASPLCVLFKFIFASGNVPNAWKSANVTPIFKKGLSSCVSNYRSISITSVFCKLYERVIKTQMLSFLQDNKVINCNQHGFLSRHSTCTQLLETINDWSISLRNRHSVEAVYFDFEKAFQSVSHQKLIFKLASYGISGNLLLTLKDFLYNRFQRVVLPNGMSSFKPVGSGVPEGSVLGPLLFLIFINDITDLFTGTVGIKLFADDIKIYLEISDDSEWDCFQRSIDNISQWAATWQLKLNVQKCQQLHVSLSRSSVHNFSLLNNNLHMSHCCRDLGINIDSRLTFGPHINSIVAKAHLRANQILRCFISRDPEILIKAFITYVRPLLEYCSPVWSPCSTGYINKIESVQRLFTKKLKDLSALSYNKRLDLLHIERLEYRRLQFDIIMCYKILHRLIALSPDEFFTYSNILHTRGHPFKLIVPNSRINARANFFSVRIVKIWNNLPPAVVNATCLSSFINKLNCFNLNVYILGKA